MSIFGTTNSLDREYHLPVEGSVAYQALVEVARGFKLDRADDFTRTVNFSTGLSALTYGERVTAQVVPASEGCNVRLSVVPRVGGQLMQGRKNQQLLEDIFQRLVERVRPD